jgi:hypothetical protein
MKQGKPIIIVSGLPRSGTSMLMKMLDAGGLEIATDGERTADVDNPKGYYELERVKQLDKQTDKSWLKGLRGKTVKIISLLLKELPDDNTYKVIFVDRNLQEVIASQNKMLVHRGESVNPDGDEKMIRTFEVHLQNIKAMLKSKPCFEVLYLNHRSILDNPAEEAAKISTFLGLNGQTEKMAAIVDPSLHRNRA